MKNIIVYVGTIKKCLNINEYKKYGDKKWTLLLSKEETNTTTAEFGIETPLAIPINEQAILIEKNGSKYEFKNNVLSKLVIYLDLYWFSILKKPLFDNDYFYDEKTLIPYYENQPKRINLRKLRTDIKNNPIYHDKY